MVWEKCFKTGLIDFEDSEEGRRNAIATGLVGWGNCMLGNKPPENFGVALVAIGKFVGCSPTMESLTIEADK